MLPRPAPLLRAARLPPEYSLVAAGHAPRACANRSGWPAPATEWYRSRLGRGAPGSRPAPPTRAAARFASANAARYLPLAALRHGGGTPRQDHDPPDTRAPGPLSPGSER